MFKWVELFLKNSKAVGALLLIMLSGLGIGTFTLFEQQTEIAELKQPPIEVIVEVPVNSGLKELKIDVKKLQRETTDLRRWHE